MHIFSINKIIVSSHVYKKNNILQNPMLFFNNETS